MVSTKDYTTNNQDYLSIETVKKSTTKIATILPGSGWNEFPSSEPTSEGNTKMEKVRKPFINVEMDGEQYEWTLNKTTNERLAEEFGSFETDDWVGRQVKLMLDKRGSQEFVTATALPKQDD